MTISYKPGVRGTPSAAIQSAISVAEAVYASFGIGLVITSIRDGQHVTNSKHYTGNAVDLRRWDLDRAGRTSAAVAATRAQLGGGYTVMLESDHIHIQYNGGATASRPTQPGSSTQPGQPQPQPSALPGVGVLLFFVVGIFLLARR